MKYLIIIFTMAGIFAGCNKDSNPKPACKINSITPNLEPVINFYYNGEGKISSLRVGEHAITLEYKDDSVIATKKMFLNFVLAATTVPTLFMICNFCAIKLVNPAPCK